MGAVLHGPILPEGKPSGLQKCSTLYVSHFFCDKAQRGARGSRGQPLARWELAPLAANSHLATPTPPKKVIYGRYETALLLDHFRKTFACTGNTL